MVVGSPRGHVPDVHNESNFIPAIDFPFQRARAASRQTRTQTWRRLGQWCSQIQGLRVMTKATDAQDAYACRHGRRVCLGFCSMSIMAAEEA